MQTKIDFFDRRLTPNDSYQVKCATGPLLDRVVSMRYRSYSSEGYINKNSSEKFMDKYDSMPNCRSYLLFDPHMGRPPVASVRACIYDPQDDLPVPVLDAFRDEVEAAIGLKDKFLEINKFVVEPKFQRRGGATARFQLFKAMAEETVSNQSKNVVLAVRESHIKFYTRRFGCAQISEAKEYPGLKFKTVLLLAKNMVMARDLIFDQANQRINRYEPIPTYSSI